MALPSEVLSIGRLEGPSNRKAQEPLGPRAIGNHGGGQAKRPDRLLDARAMVFGLVGQ